MWCELVKDQTADARFIRSEIKSNVLRNAYKCHIILCACTNFMRLSIAATAHASNIYFISKCFRPGFYWCVSSFAEPLDCVRVFFLLLNSAFIFMTLAISKQKAYIFHFALQTLFHSTEDTQICTCHGIEKSFFPFSVLLSCCSHFPICVSI